MSNSCWYWPFIHSTISDVHCRTPLLSWCLGLRHHLHLCQYSKNIECESPRITLLLEFARLRRKENTKNDDLLTSSVTRNYISVRLRTSTLISTKLLLLLMVKDKDSCLFTVYTSKIRRWFFPPTLNPTSLSPLSNDRTTYRFFIKWGLDS